MFISPVLGGSFIQNNKLFNVFETLISFLHRFLFLLAKKKKSSIKVRRSRFLTLIGKYALI